MIFDKAINRAGIFASYSSYQIRSFGEFLLGVLISDYDGHSSSRRFASVMLRDAREVSESSCAALLFKKSRKG